MPFSYLVPTETAGILQQHAEKCQHLGLILGRYVPHEVVRKDNILNDRGRVIGQQANAWLLDLAKKFTVRSGSELESLISAEFERWQARTAGTRRWQMECATPLIVGLGAKGALEFGLTLHHTTGLPMIPGSALKGLARNYHLLTIAAENNVPVETKALEDLDAELCKVENDQPDAALYRQIYGTQGDAGGCVFYDAIAYGPPADRPLFKMEVMTPHFQAYYRSGGKDAPTDADSPIPVMFVAVNAGTRFAFSVGMRKANADKQAASVARDILTTALNELGIGSKTAAGYGAFIPVG